jgi:choice-of-anchor C domain-containing protein
MRIRREVRHSSIALGLLVLTGLPASAQVNLLTNGDFEAAAITGGFTTLPGGSPTLTGWTVGGAGVDLIHNYWQAASGTQSLDLSALSAGSVSQTVPTMVGASYSLFFHMAGNPAGGNALKEMIVAITGQSDNTQQFNVTGLSQTNMGWSQRSLSFVAAAPNTTITFTSSTNNPFGPALDNVRLFQSGVNAAAPEPASMLLLSCGGLLMSARLRRRLSKA